MEVKFSGRQITLNRVESSLDKFVISFCKILAKHKINHVIVSGYVAIIFGRSRHTEDVDILFEDCGQERFEKLFSDLKGSGFECIQAKDAKMAYAQYLQDFLALRFYIGKPVPNIEFKFARKDIDHKSVNEKLELLLNGQRLFIAPLELQIAYKLYLGGDKDFEDADHLYQVLKEHINTAQISFYASNLNVKPSLVSKLVKK